MHACMGSVRMRNSKHFLDRKCRVDLIVSRPSDGLPTDVCTVCETLLSLYRPHFKENYSSDQIIIHITPRNIPRERGTMESVSTHGRYMIPPY